MPRYIRKLLLRFRPQFLLPGHRVPRTPGVYIAPSFSKKPQIAFIDKSEKLSPILVAPYNWYLALLRTRGRP